MATHSVATHSAVVGGGKGVVGWWGFQLWYVGSMAGGTVVGSNGNEWDVVCVCVVGNVIGLMG